MGNKWDIPDVDLLKDVDVRYLLECAVPVDFFFYAFVIQSAEAWKVALRIVVIFKKYLFLSLFIFLFFIFIFYFSFYYFFSRKVRTWCWLVILNPLTLGWSPIKSWLGLPLARMISPFVKCCQAWIKLHGLNIWLLGLITCHRRKHNEKKVIHRDKIHWKKSRLINALHVC